MEKAKSTLDAKVEELKAQLSDATQDAADQVDASLSLAGESASSGNAMLYGSLAFFAVAGFCAYAANKKQEKAAVEALIPEQDPDEEFQQA